VSQLLRALIPSKPPGSAIPSNRIQFQCGVSLPEPFALYGTEEQCAIARMALRRPEGVRCPRCACAAHCVVRQGARDLYQCQACRHQTSLTAGTVMECTKLPLRTWFLAMSLISQDKTGLSSLALEGQLGTSYRAAWLVHHELMAAMAEHDARKPAGNVQLDDAYLCGEQPGVAAAARPTRCRCWQRWRRTRPGTRCE